MSYQHNILFGFTSNILFRPIPPDEPTLMKQVLLQFLDFRYFNDFNDIKQFFWRNKVIFREEYPLCINIQ